MVIKVLLKVFTIWALVFTSVVSWSQCPSSVSISSDMGTTICDQTEVTFTANPTGGTGTLSYEWKIGETTVGTNSDKYITTNLSNGNKVKVIVTSSDDATCSTTSSIITMTVNAKKTPTATVSANTTSICPGESVIFTASNTNGGTSPSYSFYRNNETTALQTGSSNKLTTSSLSNGDQIRVVLTSNLGCTTSTTAEASSGTIEVRAGKPLTPDPISTSIGTDICPGTTQTYSIATVSGASSYQWTLPSGWTGTSTSTSIDIKAGNSSGTISVKAVNSCGTSEPQNLAVTVRDGTPAVPGNISGATAICPQVASTYSVTPVSGATEYIWTLPNGWNGSSTTNTIEVTPDASGSGNISVQAKNSCGTSNMKTLAVSVKTGIPNKPGAILGEPLICPGSSQTYSINPVNGASSYVWILPGGWTGSSTTNTIAVTSSSTGGEIKVQAKNDCGTGPEEVLTVSMKPGTPGKPNGISGANIVCPGQSEEYSVTPIAGATSYIWTIPSGWSGSSTTDKITVTPAQSGSGNITVKAMNDCGTSAVTSLAVNIDKPAPVMSGQITGSATVCSTATSLTYSIPAITNATEYLWSLPNGWNITGATDKNSITVNASSNSGNISVIAKNSCGSSASSASFMVSSTNGAPAKPGAISAPNLPTNAICPPATGIQFNVAAVAGAESYVWTLPAGWEITSGSGTNAIVVKVNATAATTSNASVSVEAKNVCGNSQKSTLGGISVDSHVITDAGADQTVCRSLNAINIEGNYSFSGNNKNLKPVWSVASGRGTFGDASKLSTTFTPSQAALDAGSVILTLMTDAPSGACGPGKDELTIFFRSPPTATISSTGPVCSGNTSTLSFTGTPNSKVTYRLPNNSTNTVDIGSSGTASVVTAALTSTSKYTLVSVVNQDNPICTTTFPTSASTTVTVTEKPVANLSYPGSPFCSSLTTGNPNLTGSYAFTGGTYSSTSGLTINAGTGVINPSTSTPGTYTVTYKTPEAGGCAPVITTAEVTITKKPTATISYANTPFCTTLTSAQPVTLTGTDGYSGGVFSAPSGLIIDASTGAITPGGSTAGNYTVTYNTSSAGGCAAVSATTEVTITAAPTVTISYANTPFCQSNSSERVVTITGTGAYSGGTFSSGSGLSLNQSTGAIIPAESDPGTYTVAYKAPATAGCGEVETTAEVVITETPAATISYSGPYCTSDGTSHLPDFTDTAGSYEGGTFRSNPEGLKLDPASGAVNAKESSPNTYTVFYAFPAGGGCSSTEVQTTVTITQVPQVEISYPTPLCTSDGTSYAVSYSSNAVGAYENGVFTGSTGLAIDAAGNIDPSNSTPGSHTITYTIAENSGCESIVVTTAVEIYEEVKIATQPVNFGICSTQPASFEVVATGDNLTYQWKRSDGNAITNATGINTNKLSFSNATSINAGDYYVEISGSSPCSAVTSDPATLNIDENIIIVKPTEDMTFCDQEKEDVTFEFIAHAKKAPLTFSWIKDGADIPNVNTERYEFSLIGPSDDENGAYTGRFTIKSPNPGDNGVYAVRISGPDYFTCSDATSKNFTLNVTELPDPPSVDPVVLCQGEAADPLTATGESGATFTWYDANLNQLNGAPTPSTETAGNTSYWVSQTTEVCESLKSEIVVTVNPTPPAPTTQQEIHYCFEETNIPALTATVTDSGATLTWYGPNDNSIALSEAPTPQSSSTGNTKYWVSQKIDACESDLVEILVVIDPLPELSVSADEELICEGSSTILHASGAENFIWSADGIDLGTTNDLEVQPEVTTTYTLTGTNSTGCVNTAQITINVDAPTNPGNLTGPSNVCASSAQGTLTLENHFGEIKRWEKSIDGGTTWTAIASTFSTYDFSGLTTNTDFRAVVKNGICEEQSSNPISVTIDPIPVGGELAFYGGDRVFIICENADPGYAVDLELLGYVGNSITWQYRSSSATTWNTIGGVTGSILSASDIENLNISQTTVFQALINSGVCAQNALSKTAILSVIPTDIAPSPVKVDPAVVCLGSQVTLSSDTGYTSGATLSEKGAFDNASITEHGWRVRRNGSTTDIGFDTDANNTRPDRWKRATPHPFTTANLTPNYSYTDKVWGSGVQDGNKGFAVVSSSNSATMETPVFGIGSMDEAILTFDQAYNLTPGASIKVEISTDGGNSYNTVLYSKAPTDPNLGITSGHIADFAMGTKETRPENKIEVDLGNYMGQGNLRIRFNYIGTRIGDVWAIDNIKIPEGPNGIEMEWNDYSDPDNPIYIGNNNTEKYIPKLVGWNNFEVKTILLFDSQGNSCETAENAETIKVFVFDQYTTSVTATYGSCGNFKAQLSASVVNGNNEPITSYPTPDGYIGKWSIAGGATLIDSDPNDGIEATNDPNAILSTTSSGSYTVSWILEPTAKYADGTLIPRPETCPPIVTPFEVIIEPCVALDFDGVDDYVDLGAAYPDSNYSFEAWIRPFGRTIPAGGTTDASKGTIISGKNFEIKMEDLASQIPTDDRWYHIAYTNGILYVDGILQVSNNISGTGGGKTLIGARWNDATNEPENHFSGWIEEVRIWKTSLTVEQVRFMMNQRLISNGTKMGEQIPMDVPGGLNYGDLAGYYRLISAQPEPLALSPVIYLDVDKPLNGITPDRAGVQVPGRLINMTTNQENTAPLPYYSGSNGIWGTDATWLRPNVWDPPHTGAIEWNIVRTSHDIASGNRDILLLGLISEVNTLDMQGTISGNWSQSGTGNQLFLSHYLLLNGRIDLNGESQLVQPEGSIVDASSSGELLQDQQGTASSYNYNYWSSPVSGTTGNTAHTVPGVMKDGINYKPDGITPEELNFGGAYTHADGNSLNPRKVSAYWLHKFRGTANNYFSWEHIGTTGTLKAGEGYSMKGTSGTAAITDSQNYTFVGLPHNGPIDLQIFAGGAAQAVNYLVGNPYPSAISINTFINDNVTGNASFNGSIYFWDHFAGKSHYLEEYIGGYAVANKSGGVESASSVDSRINPTNDSSSKGRPGDYIPVGQGFFVSNVTGYVADGSDADTLPDPVITTGPLVAFNNSQRAFVPQGGPTGAIFYSQNKKDFKPSTSSTSNNIEDRSKIWLKYKSPKGYHRQILVTADPNSTSGFDLGYDAPMIENNVEDMYWYIGNNEFVIQGVPDFNLDRELNMGFKVSEKGAFSVSIDELMNIPENMNIYLKDSLLMVTHNLRAEDYITESEAGIFPDRFKLVFQDKTAPKPTDEPVAEEGIFEILYVNGSREILVRNPQQLEISRIYLTNLLGQQVQAYHDIPREKEIRLPVHQYSAAVYVVKVHSEKGVSTKKVILE